MQTDRQTATHTDTDNEASELAINFREKVNTESDRQTGRLTGRQTDRHIDKRKRISWPGIPVDVGMLLDRNPCMI